MEKQELVALVTAAQSGDSDAINDLFNAFYSDVYYFALKTVKDGDLAQDITQEAFVEIINTLQNLNEPAAFVTWMKQITYHQCTRYFKKKKDLLVDEDEDGHTVFDTVAEENSDFIPDEALDKQDFKATILSMLDGLSEEQRSATLLFYFDELSVKEIAKIQNVSEGTVKSRLNYARKTIKSAVNEYEKKNGVKLHAVPFIPLIKWLFAGNTPTFAVPTAVAQGVSAATGVGVTASAVGSAAGIAGSAAGTTSAAVGIGAKIAAAPLALKIAAVTVAASVALGGGAAATIITIQNTQETSSVSSAQSSKETSSLPSSTPDTTPTPEVSSLVLEGTIPEGCIYTTADGVVLTAGDPFPEKCTEGDTVEYGDYIYGYECIRDPESNRLLYVSDMNGDYDDMALTKEDVLENWFPMVLDTTKSSYGPVVSKINGASIKGLYATYWGCNNITDLSWCKIPEGAKYLVATFIECENLKDASTLYIPDTVTNLCGTFMDCASLESFGTIPKSVIYTEATFFQCSALTGDIVINCDAEKFDSIFSSTKAPINLTGDSPDLYKMAQTARKGNVTVNGKAVTIPVELYSSLHCTAYSEPFKTTNHLIDMSLTDEHLIRYPYTLAIFPYTTDIYDKNYNELTVDSAVMFSYQTPRPMIPQNTDGNASLTYYREVLMGSIQEGITPISPDATWNELFENKEYFSLLDGTEYNGVKYISYLEFAGGGDAEVSYYDFKLEEDGQLTLIENSNYANYNKLFTPEYLKVSLDNRTVMGVVFNRVSGKKEKITFINQALDS